MLRPEILWFDNSSSLSSYITGIIILLLGMMAQHELRISYVREKNKNKYIDCRTTIIIKGPKLFHCLELRSVPVKVFNII